MGTYTEFYISQYCLLVTRDDPNHHIMTIFREIDRQIDFEKDDEENNEEERFGIYKYITTIGNAIDRLEVMGFSLVRAAKELSDGIDITLQVLQEQIDAYGEDKFWLEESLATRDILASTTIKDWISAFDYIFQHNLEFYQTNSTERGPLPPLVRYMLDNEETDYLFNFPSDDIRSLIRVFLASRPRDELVYQDVTELIMAGFYGADEPICEISVHKLTRDYPINEKIIVLTEGSSDARILQVALQLLYPHLADYYYFMDFNISNAAGGASSLVATIKAFTGSGIRNRVIGLFDNDTAARDAMRALDKLSIPDNITYFTYPEIELAKTYPTWGPNGLTESNINGLACSVELFLGRDVLTNDGRLQPVQWKGYNEALAQYQGEVLNKKRLQDLFFDKVKLCQSDPTLLLQTDWEAMKQLLQAMFNTFNFQ